MNGNIERRILGEWVDKGYWLKEYDDHVVTVGYKDKDKDKELAAFPQTAMTTTPEALVAVCQRHEARLREPAEVTK